MFVLVAITGTAQITVKGQVINERGESIEYVSIGFDEDSVGVISDAKGNSELTIPAGRKKELSFSHVSFLTTEIPYQEYASGKELTVVLKDKVVELAEVVIGKKNKPKTIVGKGIPAPGLVGTSGHGSDLGPEGGVPFSCSKEYVISDILVKISRCRTGHMSLHDIDLRMLRKKSIQRFAETEIIVNLKPRLQAINMTAPFFDLFIVMLLLRIEHQKIIMHFFRIDMAQQIHDAALRTTHDHFTDHL